MRTILLQLLHKHSDELMILLVGSGNFGVLLTDINLFLKVLTTAATLLYITLKIISHIKKNKKNGIN